MNNKIYELLIKCADLFGKVNTQIAKLPNKYILTYVLEAIDSISSNEIENIHTTIDDAYDNLISSAETPFHQYREALKTAHKNLINNEIIRAKDIKMINKMIRGVDGEYRKNTVSIKSADGIVVHKPIDANRIEDEMSKLLIKINGDRELNQTINALDIHHLFEWIHPFSDGNGRTGRIIFALLLSKYEILDVPASVFSYSILKRKNEYYSALKSADNGDKNTYYEIMLSLLIDSLEMTMDFIKIITKKIAQWLDQFEDNSKASDILWILFYGVKTHNKYIVKKTGYNNKTVSKYIDIFIEKGLIEKTRKGKNVTYKNLELEEIIKKLFIEIN